MNLFFNTLEESLSISKRDIVKKPSRKSKKSDEDRNETKNTNKSKKTSSKNEDVMFSFLLEADEDGMSDEGMAAPQQDQGEAQQPNEQENPQDQQQPEQNQEEQQDDSMGDEEGGEEAGDGEEGSDEDDMGDDSEDGGMDEGESEEEKEENKQRFYYVGIFEELSEHTEHLTEVLESVKDKCKEPQSITILLALEKSVEKLNSDLTLLLSKKINNISPDNLKKLFTVFNSKIKLLCDILDDLSKKDSQEEPNK